MEMDFLCVIYFSTAVLHYSCSYQKETGKLLLYFKVCKIPAVFFIVLLMCALTNNILCNKYKCICISIHKYI